MDQFVWKKSYTCLSNLLGFISPVQIYYKTNKETTRREQLGPRGFLTEIV